MAAFKWTPRREQFCVEFIVDLNATQAAIRAGYAAKNAEKEACRLMALPEIQERISEQKAQRVERTQVDSDYVLGRLVEIDQMDVADILDKQGSLKPVLEWPKVWRTYISGFDVAELFEGRGEEREQIGMLKKIKWPDKVKNLELLGKHVDVQAFQEKIEHNVGRSLADLMAEAVDE